MSETPRRRARRLWQLAGGIMVAILATLPLTPPIANALRIWGQLGLAVWAVTTIIVGVGLLLLARLLPRLRPPAAIALLGVALVLVVAMLDQPRPEERFHFVEYGALGAVIFAALRAAAWRRSRAALLALLLGAAGGLLDEAVQWLLPMRHFDWRDVAMNSVGAALGTAAGLAASYHRPAVGLAAALLLLSAQFANARPATDVVLVTIDSLRADHITPHTAPHLSQLMADGRTFTQARATSTWTSPSMVSVLSALSPPRHGVDGRHRQVWPGHQTPVEVLAAAGYRTFGYVDYGDNYAALGIQNAAAKSPAAAVRAAATTEGPFFLWLHLRDVHLPYGPPAPSSHLLSPEARRIAMDYVTRSPVVFREKVSLDALTPDDRAFIRRRYAAGVHTADAALGEVLRALATAKRRALVAVTADHGEELFERGHVGHASTSRASLPYEELLRVPLVLSGPGIPRGQDSRPAEVTDIMPTLLERLSLPVDPGWDGQPLLAQRSRTGSLAFSTTCGWQCRSRDRNHYAVAYTNGHHKLIWRAFDDVAFGFDLRSDPGEGEPLPTLPHAFLNRAATTLQDALWAGMWFEAATTFPPAQ